MSKGSLTAIALASSGTCIICMQQKELSDEHIVPEFLGGTLKVANVCQTCNSLMGKDFERRLADSFFVMAFREEHNIIGKSGPRSPFSGTHTCPQNGVKYKVNYDGSRELFNECELLFQEDGTVIFQGSFDPLREEQFLREIETKLTREVIRRKGTKPDPEKIAMSARNMLNDALKGAERQQLHLNITGKIKVDFNDIMLLMIKVAYEMATYHFGQQYLTDPVATKLRNCLCVLDPSDASIWMNPTELPFLCNLSPDYHWIIFTGKLCYVQLEGIPATCIIEVKEEISNELAGYRFSFKSKDYAKLNMEQLIDTLFCRDTDIP